MFPKEKKIEYETRHICGREIPGSRRFPLRHQVLSRPLARYHD